MCISCVYFFIQDITIYTDLFGKDIYLKEWFWGYCPADWDC